MRKFHTRVCHYCGQYIDDQATSVNVGHYTYHPFHEQIPENQGKYQIISVAPKPNLIRRIWTWLTSPI